MRNLVLIALLIRFLTNIQGFSDYLYFVGRDILEASLMYVIYSVTLNKWVKDLLLLCIGLSIWNIFKPLFFDVTKHDLFEYIGFVIGIALVMYKRYGKSL